MLNNRGNLCFQFERSIHTTLSGFSLPSVPGMDMPYKQYTNTKIGTYNSSLVAVRMIQKTNITPNRNDLKQLKMVSSLERR